ncbi:MAG: hypothetical protein ABID04_01660 [Patescibacteria group bacterium]
MRPISTKVQEKIRQLRKKGFSHRDIFLKLGVSVGSAFKYSYDIKLSEKQQRALRRRNIKYLVSSIPGPMSPERREACRRGGLNTPSKFVPLYSREDLLGKIKDFVKSNGRIPFKRELPQYRAVRRVFGTWNKAIHVAGFEPNPVKFAKKYIAKDGHKCDSLSERIIDDWLFRRGINHQINVAYPGGDRLTVDFLVGDYWIEFFGLSGEHRRYDWLKNRKKKVAKHYSLNLVELYPSDLFPIGKLNEKFRAIGLGE